MWATKKLFLFFLILSLYISCVITINCFECDSNNEAHCAEAFNPDHLNVNPTSCDSIHEARYCIKATGMYEGTIGTKRFCSSRHHGNYCEYIKRPGDDREYRSCVYTCYQDGCNSASESVASILIYFSTLVTIIYHVL